MSSVNTHNSLQSMTPFAYGEEVECRPYCLTLKTPETCSLTKKILNSTNKSWAYTSNFLSLSRYTINTVLNSEGWVLLREDHIASMKQYALGTKLFSVISVPFTLSSIDETMQAIWKSLCMGDSVGALLSSLNVSIASLGLFDSITSFTNAVLQATANVPIAWISAIGPALGVTIFSLNVINRSIQIGQLKSFLDEFNDEVVSQMDESTTTPESLRKALSLFLSEKLGEGSSPVKYVREELEKNVSQLRTMILERETNPKVVRLLKELKTLVTSTDTFGPNEMKKVTKLVEEIKKNVLKETFFAICNLLISINGLVALLLMLGAVSSVGVLPFVMLTVGLVAKITLQITKDVI